MRRGTTSFYHVASVHCVVVVLRSSYILSHREIFTSWLLSGHMVIVVHICIVTHLLAYWKRHRLVSISILIVAGVFRIHRLLLLHVVNSFRGLLLRVGWQERNSVVIIFGEVVRHSRFVYRVPF